MSAIVLLALAAPQAMSADFCADQLMLALADRPQIAALSVDADKDFSYFRAKAEGLRQTRADAEQALALDAQVVLRFWGGDAARLERLGVKVVTLNYAADFEAVKENVKAAASALGQTARGDALNREIDLRLAALRARGSTGVSAIYVTPGGVTAGKGTMIDAIFAAAGVNNAAADAGLSFWPPLAAETLVADPPEFIVAGFFAAASERINHWSAARHRALRKVLSETPRIDLPADVLACPGAFSLDAAEAIRDAINRRERNHD